MSEKLYHYVYQITNLTTNLKYIGKRSSKIPPFNDLGKKYFSSSSNTEFIMEQKSNPSNFKYEILKEFDTATAAVAYEVELHQLYDVGVNPEFYNKVKQTSSSFDITGSGYIKKIISESQSGSNNSQYGKIWITNEQMNTSIKINKNELDGYLARGWAVGRKSKKFLEKMFNNAQFVEKESANHMIGKSIKIHRNGIIIQTNMLYFYRDYFLDGWKLFPQRDTCKGSVKITNIETNDNLMIHESILQDFLINPSWKVGFFNPNHRGTRGLKYTIVAGKKIFSK